MTKNDVTKKLQEIANLLSGWSVDTAKNWDHGGYLDGPDGARIFIRLNGYPRRGEAHCQFPKNNNGRYMSARDWGVISYNEQDPQIGFNPEKAAQAIARDLERRLIAKYLPLYVECCRRKDEEKRSYEAQTSYIEQVSGIIGGDIRGEFGSKTLHIYGGQNSHLYGDINADYDGRFSMNLRGVSAIAMEKIAHILKAEMGDEGE